MYSLATYSRQQSVGIKRQTERRQTVRSRKWLLIGLVAAWVFAVVEVFHVAGTLVTADSRDLHYTVIAGDTVWSIAEKFAGDRDPRAVMDQMVDTNHLEQSVRIHPGQVLNVPRG